jgi:hypothetical protein
MVDWFTGLKEALDLDALTKQLRGIRLDLRVRFPRGSASFIVVHTSSRGRTTVVHAGDCLLGKIGQADRIQWETHPHTLANVLTEVPLEELSKTPARHLLTKSFRSREYMAPDFLEMDTCQSILTKSIRYDHKPTTDDAPANL